MKKALSLFFISVLAGALASCNNYNNNNGYYTAAGTTTQSQFPVRAFVSNPIQPNGIGGASPALDIVDAVHDLVSTATISLVSLTATSSSAGMMAVSPKRDRTLVFSPGDNRLAIVNNSSDSLVTSATLPGPTESFFVENDDVTAFVAVPGASIPGQAPGAVERVDLATGSITATIPVPGAHNIVPSPDGSMVLVLSDNSDAVTLIVPNLIGAGTQSNAVGQCSSTQGPACVIPGIFDRPIWAVFNGSGTTAYVLNCGEQCGGAGAGTCLTFTSCTTVTALDITQSPPVLGASVAVPAATTGLLQGNSLYVAGTPAAAADNSCAGITTAATSCGRLSLVDVAAMTVATPVAITDGYHNKMDMGPNGQLFVGSRNCTNVNIPNGEVRGCLTIVNTSAGVAAANVIAPQDNGDVTGIAPIPSRPVVYVCEGGRLRIYDTSTGKLGQLSSAPRIVGQAVDVKVVDF